MGAPAQDAFDALSDPTRREILRLLAENGEMTAGEVADSVSAVGRTAVSSHLRILRQAGLVVERREGALPSSFAGPPRGSGARCHVLPVGVARFRCSDRLGNSRVEGDEGVPGAFCVAIRAWGVTVLGRGAHHGDARAAPFAVRGLQPLRLGLRG